MFMEQSHNKQVASVDIFPTQCSSSIGSNGVIIVSFTVRNDSLMRVMLFIQHTVTGWLWVNKIFHLKVLHTAYSVHTLFSRHDWQTNLILITDQPPHKKGKWQMATEMTIAITMKVTFRMTMTMMTTFNWRHRGMNGFLLERTNNSFNHSWLHLHCVMIQAEQQGWWRQCLILCKMIDNFNQMIQWQQLWI